MYGLLLLTVGFRLVLAHFHVWLPSLQLPDVVLAHDGIAVEPQTVQNCLACLGSRSTQD